METLRLSIDSEAALAHENGVPSATLMRLGGILRHGGTVAFATETVYGLGANALDASAVAKIFIAKQRPAWDPLIVHIADESMLSLVVANIPAAARVLIDRFWPGPLTLLMPRHPDLPDAVTAGRSTVGVRMPAHPVARSLIRAARKPIAAPSANTFGHVSPTTAAHVAADLDGRIDAILDSGETTLGLESTVLDTCVDPCVLYRPGAITLEQLRAAWPSVEAYVEAPGTRSLGVRAKAAASPGLGMRHYAPHARLILVEEDDPAAGLAQALENVRVEGGRAGLMLPHGLGTFAVGAAVAVFDWGAWGEPAELAHRLFAGLRALDDQGVQVIICPLPKPVGMGVAIIDRLRKAARRI